ncbi:hypothetical protein PanWU01x14_222890, partial [Parasponia andersonii]
TNFYSAQSFYQTPCVHLSYSHTSHTFLSTYRSIRYPHETKTASRTRGPSSRLQATSDPDTNPEGQKKRCSQQKRHHPLTPTPLRSYHRGTEQSNQHSEGFYVMGHFRFDCSTGCRSDSASGAGSSCASPKVGFYTATLRFLARWRRRSDGRLRRCWHWERRSCREVWVRWR